MRALLPLILISFVAMPATPAATQTLRGSRSSVEHIHAQAVRHDLHFYETGAGVRRAAGTGTFVRLSDTRDYRLANVTYPYLLPTAHAFVTRLAAQYRVACGERLVVTSAVRPRSVRLVNSAEKTVHPTGMAVDLRKPTKARCLNWLRETLLALEAEGVIDAVEERRPPHFHVAVFPTQYRQYVQAHGGDVKLAVAPQPDAKPAEKRGASTGPAVRTRSTVKVTHRVRRGETLWDIARRHGTSVETLKNANDIRSSRIVAGQVLVIPKTR